MLCTQLDTALVQQLDTFLNNDMNKLGSLKEAFNVARTGKQLVVVIVVVIIINNIRTQSVNG